MNRIFKEIGSFYSWAMDYDTPDWIGVAVAAATCVGVIIAVIIMIILIAEFPLLMLILFVAGTTAIAREIWRRYQATKAPKDE